MRIIPLDKLVDFITCFNSSLFKVVSFKLGFCFKAKSTLTSKA